MTPAAAGSDTAPVTLGIEIVNPVLDLNNLNFGDTYLAVNHTSTSASATIAPDFALSHISGAPGTARLLPIDTAARNTLRVTVSAGIPFMDMSISITDNNTGQPFMIMTGVTTPGDATFRVDNWTYAVQPGGGSVSGFSGATGSGVITLNASGGIDIRFGATMRTVPGPNNYSEQDYSGTLNVTIDY